MVQISILRGIYTDGNADYRTAYPRNMVPVPKLQGVSQGYLRPAPGIEEFAAIDGLDRGGINWNGVMYRVIGTKLCSVDASGVVTELGSISGTDRVKMDYSFNRLAICADKKLYYYDGTNLTRVTDEDLGEALDVLWVDGYFLSTDGEYIVAPELNNPADIDPLKYGSSEFDPDRIVGLRKISREPYAINRYSIEVFSNIGGDGFPFQRIDGAQMSRGAISRDACTVFQDALYFVGSGRNEPLAVWAGTQSRLSKISTQEIDRILEEYTEEALAADILLEERVINNHAFLYIHLSDQTLVYDASASVATSSPVWFTLTGGITDKGRYPARNFVYCYNKTICGHPGANKLGYLTDNVATHYGEKTTWEFSTLYTYNSARSMIIKSLELIGLPGRAALGNDPRIALRHSQDGITFSQPRFISAGKSGERFKRMVWRRLGRLKQAFILNISGDSNARLSVAALEADIEAGVS